nr:MAG TPA: hypothetical protein [Caudoviricetes sp.]
MLRTTQQYIESHTRPDSLIGTINKYNITKINYS